MHRFIPLLGLSLLLNLLAQAQPTIVPVDTENSVISYTGDAILHGWTGVSHGATGTLVVDMADPANSRIDVSAPMESFDSGNSSRDSNMLDAVEVERYPEVRFVSTQITAGAEPGTWMVRGDLTLHGQTHPVELPVQVTAANSTFEGTGRFDVSLTQHGIRRPKIMLVRVGDAITVDFTIRAPLPASMP